MSTSTATFLREEEEDLVLVAFSAPFPIFGLCGFVFLQGQDSVVE